jgi:hypothetical protein
MSAADGPRRTGLPAPLELLRLDAREADALLDRLEAEVPSCPGVVRLDVPGADEAIVIGDTHGDWRSTEAAVDRFLEDPRRRLFVGLGDYLDRAPDDCAEGSVVNALLLLDLVARYPQQVVLLRGNHEMNRAIPVLPHDVPEEVDALWGPEPERCHRLEALLERGPLAAVTASGAYFAHAGFPRNAGADWATRLDRPDEELLLDQVWAECSESRLRRGVPRFTLADWRRFSKQAGVSIFLRGHDPDLNGRWSFDGHCLTLHTSRIYERYGGVLMARVDLKRPASQAAVQVEHLPTEGLEFERP